MSKFTHKTRDGRKAYILPERGNNQWPILAVVQQPGSADTFFCESYTKELKVEEGTDSFNDLFEYNPAEDLKIDQPIWVRDKVNKHWYNRHFCKYENKTVYCWGDGKTSFTTGTYSPWAEFTTTDPEV